MNEPVLELVDVNTSYGESHVLQDVSLTINQDEIIALLGRNGAGKTTTLRSIIGTQPPFSGSITFQGEPVTNMNVYERADRGIKFVPEDRRIFGTLTVEEHLEMAVDKEYRSADEEFAAVYDSFPKLEELRERQAEGLSGGEQQMLAIARALIGPTELLMLDEPSEGLAPQIIESIYYTIDRLKEETTILLVEQNYPLARELADRYYLLDQGEIISHGDITELDQQEKLKEEYLGVA